MRRDIITSAIAMLALTLLLGIAYPLLITGVAQVTFPGNANGQQIKQNGRLIGSKIVGQNFGRPVLERNGKPKEEKGAVVTEPVLAYFQSRPSATEGGAYNAEASTFSNRGPNSTRTAEADAENIKAYLELNTAPGGRRYDPSLTVGRIPVDAINTSGSNLDPEISKANAWIQAYRVAALRRLPLGTVDGLIGQYTRGRGLGFAGEEGVDVLELNLALDRLTGGPGR
jgi:K+-transporting ATPase ATPase C chain